MNRSPRIAAIVIAALLHSSLYSFEFSGDADAYPITRLNPVPRFGSTGVWDGQHVWLFGGGAQADVPDNLILRWDPATNLPAVVAPVTLPFPLMYAASVWVPQGPSNRAVMNRDCVLGCAYILGGLTIGAGGGSRLVASPAILQFNPATNQVRTVGAMLTPVYYAFAANVLDKVYLFGGLTGLLGHDAATTQIVEFDPETGLSAYGQLSSPAWGTSTHVSYLARDLYVEDALILGAGAASTGLTAWFYSRDSAGLQEPAGFFSGGGGGFLAPPTSWSQHPRPGFSSYDYPGATVVEVAGVKYIFGGQGTHSIGIHRVAPSAWAAGEFLTEGKARLPGPYWASTHLGARELVWGDFDLPGKHYSDVAKPTWWPAAIGWPGGQRWSRELALYDPAFDEVIRLPRDDSHALLNWGFSSSSGPSTVAMASDGARVWFFGRGTFGASRSAVYDSNTNQVLSLGSVTGVLPAASQRAVWADPQFAPAGCVLGCVYFKDGDGRLGLFNPATRVSELRPLPSPFSSATGGATIIRGDLGLYLAGRRASGAPELVIASYDARTGVATELATHPVGDVIRFGEQAEGKIWLVGQEGRSYVFDPVLNLLRAGPQLRNDGGFLAPFTRDYVGGISRYSLESFRIRLTNFVADLDAQHPSNQLVQVDQEVDGLGDQWQETWNELSPTLISAPADADGDGLSNVDEFRWLLVPVCTFANCLDHERDMVTGAGGDNWWDGPEVRYWNNPIPAPSTGNVAVVDPDRFIDSDRDGLYNVDDADADNDGLLDGDEATGLWGTYPEFADSDCAVSAVACTYASDTFYWALDREGAPGTGDGWNDAAELTYWTAAGLLGIDRDDDGISSNMLDADVDGDTVPDGWEHRCLTNEGSPGGACTDPFVWDSDYDQLLDGNDLTLPESILSWRFESAGIRYRDNDDGTRTFLGEFVPGTNGTMKDTDSDALPDAWEAFYGLPATSAANALQDTDRDGLTDRDEYAWGDASGQRFITNYWDGTNPVEWDTDLDTMPDGWEAAHQLNPRSGSDKNLDADKDAFANSAEYAWTRPPTWDEGSAGWFQQGTNPRNWDTDADLMPDGWEVRYALDPRTNEVVTDPDSDGLGNREEYRYLVPPTWTVPLQGVYWGGTNPRIADTDHDELSDGVEALQTLTLATHWDTDGDLLPDAWEVEHSASDAGSATNPLVADAGLDADLDSVPYPWCTNAGRLFTNREEYAYSMPAAWNSAPSGNGVWHNGTRPGDADSDDDSVRDGYEVCLGDSDPRTAEPLQADRDSDGLSDAAEVERGTSYADPDSDNDLLCDGGRAPGCRRGSAPGQPGEVLDYQTDPFAGDTDGDQWGDGPEATYWDAAGSGTVPDTDGDAQDNLHDADSDGDGTGDFAERFSSEPSDPAQADTDQDGLTDSVERTGWSIMINGLQRSVTSHPGVSDSDADGLSDFAEKDLGTDPRSSDSDLDGAADNTELSGWAILLETGPVLVTSDPRDRDSDQDGLLDGIENTLGTNPRIVDTDGDKITDSQEDANRNGAVDANEPSPILKDTDRDGLEDGIEVLGWEIEVAGQMRTGTSHPRLTDTDADGLDDLGEFSRGIDARLVDTDGDGLCDGGRTAPCRRNDQGTTGFKPGELDYGSMSWSADSDADGLTDLAEAVRWDQAADGEALDVDGDLLNGIVDPDSDNDRLLDGDEVTRGTKPDIVDSDNDGLADGDEVLAYGTNPRVIDTDADGLTDHAEINVAHTKPTVADTDADGLSDGSEIAQHGTDPLVSDSDQDGVPDGWEVSHGTFPRTSDADQDPDADGLVNAYEFMLGTHAMRNDTDADTMPDAYEDQWGMNPLLNDGNLDLDGDNLPNKQEKARGTKPTAADTDLDGLNDGLEVFTYGSDPLVADTDADGLEDGAEIASWNAGGWSWSANHDGDTFVSALRDADSDADGLDDGDEFVSTHTYPHDSDTDNDGLSDSQEVMVYRGQYDPNKFDTDGDGQSDGVEVALADQNGDFDQDGLNNGNEEAKGTDPTRKDSDCDGVQDGPESAYWGASWNVGGNRLLNPDVDGDSLNDGLEIGTTGTRNQALYKTRPDLYDTDGDGLWDNAEDTNKFTVECPEDSGTQTQSASNPVPGPSWDQLTREPWRVIALDANTTYEDIDGTLYGLAEQGLYLLGSFGVEFFPTTTLLPSMSSSMTASSGPTSRPTNPMRYDTDGDGLGDGLELNEYGTMASGPGACDTDGDRLGDGLEVGLVGVTVDTADPCTHRSKSAIGATPDADSDGVLDVHQADSDTDGRQDGLEDSNANGFPDLLETSHRDADTDDDGLCDDEERARTAGALNPLNPDTDGDGLSDGLESHIYLKCSTNGTEWTSSDNSIVCRSPTDGRTVVTRKTWQPGLNAQQFSTDPQMPDSDHDGLLDGVEDWNANGIVDEGETAPYSPPGLGIDEQDTDGDGLSDGVEVRLWGDYTFCQLRLAPNVNSNADLFGFTHFNPSDLADRTIDKRTDPTASDTDGDNINDGLDIAPNGAASVFWNFVDYTQLERVDPGPSATCWNCESPWRPDLRWHVNMIDPRGTLRRHTTYEIDLPDARNPVNLLQFFGTNPPSGTTIIEGVAGAPTATLPGASWNANVLRFPLWSDVRAYASGQQCALDAVCVGTALYDVDGTDEDDQIDVVRGDRRSYSVATNFNPGDAGPPNAIQLRLATPMSMMKTEANGFCAIPRVIPELNGKADGGTADEDDARLWNVLSADVETYAYTNAATFFRTGAVVLPSLWSPVVANHRDPFTCK
jgi:hypothetical protein